MTSSSSSQFKRLTEPRKSWSLGALVETGAAAAELVSSDSIRQTQAMESVVSIARVEDRTDRRIAEILANEDRPLLMHAESMNPFTLRFKDPNIEEDYRKHFMASWGKYDSKVVAPTYSVVVDIMVATAVFVLVSMVAWVVFGPQFSAWVIYFSISAVILLLFLGYLMLTFLRSKRLIPLVTSWYPRHLVSMLLIELPIGAALTNLACFDIVISSFAASSSPAPFSQDLSGAGVDLAGRGADGAGGGLPEAMSSPVATTRSSLVTDPSQLVVFYIAFTLFLAHCNFSPITHWMKTGFAILLGIVVVLLAALAECPCHILSESIVASGAEAASVISSGAQSNDGRVARASAFVQEAYVDHAPYVAAAQIAVATTGLASTSVLIDGGTRNGTNHLTTTPLPSSSDGTNGGEQESESPLAKLEFFHGRCLFRWESILDVALALLLVAFLNRQFESIFRMSFFGDVQAVKDTQQMQQSKEQADWLLSNIIPDFVLDKLKANSKYSENNDLVAVMFASIINWNQFYEESYKGGREFLRVLNEIIGDFDALLDEPQFNQIEKIKTIGSTYMAAAGLNAEKRAAAATPDEHLLQLVEFALAIQDKLAKFNEDMLSFEFIMKIGYNIGPVTAGVIGTTKLYYDIWGDTVNIASRMYSTGVPRRIQVSDRSIDRLSHAFEFEFRDHIAVKGIDKGMDVYLLVGRKPQGSESPQQASSSIPQLME